MTEKDIYNQLCKIPNVYWMRIESGMTLSGIPDLNGICKGIEFWVELKTGAPRMKPSQVSWFVRARAQGRRCFVLTGLSCGCEVYRPRVPSHFQPIDSKHFTPIKDTLIYSGSIALVTNCLTMTYAPDKIVT